MDSSRLTGWPKAPVGKLGTDTVNRPPKLRLKAKGITGSDSTVKGGSARGKRSANG